MDPRENGVEVQTPAGKISATGQFIILAILQIAATYFILVTIQHMSDTLETMRSDLVNHAYKNNDCR